MVPTLSTQGSATPIKSPEPKPQTVTTQAATKVLVQTVSQANPPQPIVPQASPSVSTKILNKPVANPQQQKLVLLNVNGQLLTQQGVPVTLQGGVLRPLGPAQVRVSSPKLVVSNPSVNRAPVPTIRAQSPQVQKVATTSGGDTSNPETTPSCFKRSTFAVYTYCIITCKFTTSKSGNTTVTTGS